MLFRSADAADRQALAADPVVVQVADSAGHRAAALPVVGRRQAVDRLRRASVSELNLRPFESVGRFVIARVEVLCRDKNDVRKWAGFSGVRD